MDAAMAGDGTEYNLSSSTYRLLRLMYINLSIISIIIRWLPGIGFLHHFSMYWDTPLRMPVNQAPFDCIDRITGLIMVTEVGWNLLPYANRIAIY